MHISRKITTHDHVTPTNEKRACLRRNLASQTCLCTVALCKRFDEYCLCGSFQSRRHLIQLYTRRFQRYWHSSLLLGSLQAPRDFWSQISSENKTAVNAGRGSSSNPPIQCNSACQSGISAFLQTAMVKVSLPYYMCFNFYGSVLL